MVVSSSCRMPACQIVKAFFLDPSHMPEDLVMLLSVPSVPVCVSQGSADCVLFPFYSPVPALISAGALWINDEQT